MMNGKRMVGDGPICQDQYLAAPLRIVHLLKNPTQENESFSKLISTTLCSGNLGRTFLYRLATRSHGILNRFAPWAEIAGTPDSLLGRSLTATAIINLAYDEFSATVDGSAVYRWASEKRERWHTALGDCRPNVAVCGGTFRPVWEALGQPAVRTATTGMHFFADPEIAGCVYIDAPHPSARYPVAMVHTYLMASCQVIMRSA